ncbi:MAG: aminotransferase class III-fold pyridoxal phosphate-dependent enzyme [Candidatus Zeuxoniibacter abyssi]|nr:MAG: aminotransferase class III-fold pyridoxal phosphate-dependent enzyme [Candidatus Persebacteraceae bacterium AB1(2)]
MKKAQEFNASDDAIRHAHTEHYIQSWSVQGAAEPLVIAGGKGCWFWDTAGKRYLDFKSQLVNLNLGFQHPDIVEAIKQAEKLCYIGPGMANDTRSELATRMAEITPGNLSRTFFTTAGADANENAVRLARHFTGRRKIIARYRSYHGATAGGLTLSGDPRHWFSEAGGGGGDVVRILDPYTYRCPAGHPTPCPVCSGAPHLEEILTYENPASVAAVLLETVVGTNGIIYPPDGYLRAIRETCTKHGILLILDEIMTAFGRTGKWFACDHWEVVPDILCVAKGINSGYVPLGAMTVSQEISQWLKNHSFPGGLTYAGHPLACASAVAAIKVYERDNIIAQAAKRGETLANILTALAKKHPSIGDVRGRGLFFGLETVKNRKTREPLVPFNAKNEAALPVKKIIKFAMGEGLYISAYSNIIRLAPPLIISPEELNFAGQVLDRALDIADEYVE